jgi:hypothetical protein
MLTRLLRPTTFAYNKVPTALVKTNNTLLSINKTTFSSSKNIPEVINKNQFL